MATLGETLVGAVVDESVQVEALAVLEHAEDEVVIAVAVEVGQSAGAGAVGGDLGELGLAQGVAVDVDGRLLEVAMVVAEDQVDVAVAVEVVLVDSLEHARVGDVEVLTTIAKSATAERIESLRRPGAGRGHTDAFRYARLKREYGTRIGMFWGAGGDGRV